MTKIKFSGPLALRLGAIAAINRAAMTTYAARLLGRSPAPDWDMNTEIGVRFMRAQFTAAMRAIRGGNPMRGRQILDALQTETDDVYEVEAQPVRGGVWYRPRVRRSQATVLYYHGGGYAFHGAMSARFAAMLAHHIGAPLFAAEYRLTPEHPAPAQSEDAMAAWEYVASEVPAREVVVIGDSAGGHMALMQLIALRDAGKPQPALCVGLCPWTDIGEFGASLTENDPTDLVSGWMAVEFGQWLDPGLNRRAALSPMAQDYTGLAPIYLQAGGREVLRDMILGFAETQAGAGADVLCELWPLMPHDFQLFDSTQEDAGAALLRITDMVKWAVGGAPKPPQTALTHATGGVFG